MSWRNVWAVARKDLIEVRQNQSAWLPMLIVPVIFIIIMPLALIVIPTQFPADSLQSDPDMQTFFERMPATLTQSLVGLNDVQRMLVVALGYFFAPFFLILPLMTSTSIAAESFAGERERKTMEALLYSAATDTELFFGKVVAGTVPAMLVAWLSFVGYTLVLNGAGWPIFGRIWFPLAGWWPLVFWVSPALAVFGVSLTVLISKRMQTFMGAYQTSSSAVLLIVALMGGQIAGVIYFDLWVGLGLGVVLWLVDAVLMWFAVRTFNRSTLLASMH